MELQEPIFEQYLNDGQAYMLMMMPRDLVAECGRGFGKGLVQAGRGLKSAQLMEGSCGAAVCPSVKRGLTNIVPSWMIHWENWGQLGKYHCILQWLHHQPDQPGPKRYQQLFVSRLRYPGRS